MKYIVHIWIAFRFDYPFISALQHFKSLKYGLLVLLSTFRSNRNKSSYKSHKMCHFWWIFATKPVLGTDKIAKTIYRTQRNQSIYPNQFETPSQWIFGMPGINLPAAHHSKNIAIDPRLVLTQRDVQRRADCHLHADLATPYPSCTNPIIIAVIICIYIEFRKSKQMDLPVFTLYVYNP